MRRLLFLFLFFSSCLFVYSQTILDTTIQGVNCNHDGYIYLDITNVNTLSLDWEFYSSEDSVWLGSVDTLSGFLWWSSDKDSLEITKCGTYRVILSPGDTSIGFYVSCSLDSRGRQESVLCNGDSTGLVKRVAYSGNPPYTYTWFKDSIPYSTDNDTLLDTLSVGFYHVIITDTDTCSVSVPANIISPPALSFDSIIITDSIHCRGSSQAALKLILSGGKPYTVDESYDCFLINSLSDTVAWVTRDSLSLNLIVAGNVYQIDSLFSGMYTLSILDTNGCILDTVFEIKEPMPYVAFGSTIGGILECESDSGDFMIDSIISDSILGSDSLIYGFLYYPNDTIYVPSGTYQIYVQDLKFECLDTVTIICDYLYKIEITPIISDVDCFGDSTGTISLVISGGNIPYDRQWGGLDSTALPAGTHTVHVVDAKGCLKTDSFFVNQGSQIIPNEVLYHPSCSYLSGSIAIAPFGGTGALTWSLNNSFLDSLYGLSGGLYTLEIEDSIGCLETFNMNIVEPDTLGFVINIDQPDLLCFGGLTSVDISIFGGTNPYIIDWSEISDTTGNSVSPNDSTSTSRVMGAGTYEIQVIDANGCLATDYYTITEPSPLEVLITYTNISCVEGGSATAIVSGGTAPFSYLWSTPGGDTTQTIDSLSPSIYWIVVTDECANSINDTIYLDDYKLFTEVYYDEETHTAEVEIESTNSEGPFSYEWQSIDINTAPPHAGIINVNGINSGLLCEGNYYVVTTDLIENCTDTLYFSVEYYLPLGILNVSNTTVLDTSDLWGADAYTYNWCNGENSRHADICFHCEGDHLGEDHFVEVIDSDGCFVREPFNIEELVISLDPESVLIKCDINIMDIDITALATGGTPFTSGETYDYLWWNGDTINSINSGMSPGTNPNVTVTDANGCSTYKSFVIETMTSECISNVFTPNGDTENATWSLDDTFLYEDSEVRVYGRFGKLVFHSVGYNNAWDGTDKQGNDVPAGAYFYSIEVGHGFDPINGTVTILR